MRGTMQQSSAALLAKLKASGRYTQISDDEYKRMQREQFARLDRTMQERQRQADLAHIGLTENELKLNWKNIDPNISDGQKALDIVLPMYESGYGMVFLYGKWGQAKTLIGKILTATAYRDGRRASYANVSDVLSDIRSAFDSENQNRELIRRVERWSKLDVLFLDELDKANETPWATSTLFTLLDKRYVGAVRNEVLTVIASNKSEDELDGYLKSRLHDRRVSKVVYLSGQDGREVMPEQWKF